MVEKSKGTGANEKKRMQGRLVRVFETVSRHRSTPAIRDTSGTRGYAFPTCQPQPPV